ncbi:hypothetical protein C8J57DRAFT_1714824 [Mycena rebaudengoi]|nr:hypothetical protein C8J57DRAFT_1714824 [Mycena rebaudengoi]
MRAHRSDREPAVPNVPMLPPEVHYLVINQSASDKEELSRLSLISPTWASYSQSLLFARVELRGSATPAKFLALLQRNPTLGRHVPQEFWLEYAGIMEFLDRSLQDCLLHIAGASFEIAKPVGAAAAATFAEITSLRLTYLTALQLWGLQIRSGGTADVHSANSMPNTAPLHLRSLSVDEESLSLVLEWLSTYAKLPTLDGLRTSHEAIHLQPRTALRDVSLEGATKGAHILPFIQQLASQNIERISVRLGLHVKIMGEDSTSTAWDQIDALLAGPDFPHLKQLVLDFNLWGSAGPQVFRAAIQSEVST